MIGYQDTLSVQRNIIQAPVMQRAEMTNGAFPAGWDTESNAMSRLQWRE
jgi:hypothetical protein